MSIYNDKNPKKTQTEEEKRNGCFNIALGAFVAICIVIYMTQQ